MTKAADFVSELSSPAERWLARVMVQTLQEGFRTAEDFVEFFSPAEIMESLDGNPDLRATILVEAAGVHERIARKKSTNSAAEDLRIALEEGICNASTVLDLFPADARVAHLERSRLWTFLTEDEFWASVSNTDQAIKRVQFMLETALDEELITLQEIADGISFEEIAKRLPREDLETLVVEALKLGRKRSVFDEASLVDAVPLSALLGHLALETVWDTVVVDKIAKPAALLGGGAPREKSSSSSASDASSPSATKNNKNKNRKKTVAGPASALKPQAAAPPKPPAAPPAPPVAKPEEPPPVLDEPKEVTIQADELVFDEVRSPQEEEARKRVADKLSAIDRLPPKHETLPTGILLSMESMYAELFQLSTDEEREECIRDSFPNEAHLTQAMLALIELLDPSIDITDPVIRDADVASLIKVVLFEERHRAEQANPSRGSGAPAPPTGSRRPPPLPGVGKSTPPPLPIPSRAPRPR